MAFLFSKFNQARLVNDMFQLGCLTLQEQGKSMIIRAASIILTLSVRRHQLTTLFQSVRFCLERQMSF